MATERSLLLWKAEPIFSKFGLFYGCVPRVMSNSILSVQLLHDAENTRRYVERCGYQQTENHKMPPTAILGIYLHKPNAGSLTWTIATAFRSGWVLLILLESFSQ